MYAYGTAQIRGSAAVTAGSYQTVVYTYTAGHPIDDTGYVLIVFRFAGDFGTPQFTRPEDENYCSIAVSGDCRIEPRWDPKGYTRPWGKALYLKVTGGFLGRGETVTVIFGDRRQGSAGWRVQTFCEGSFEFRTLVDPFAVYRFRELDSSPVLRIVPGEPVKAVCIAPSQVPAGSEFTVRLRLEDRWGNAIGPAGVHTHRAPAEEGVFTVQVQDPVTGLSAGSNPIFAAENPGAQPARWWADFHGQTEETIGTNTIDEYYAYARDCAVLDICAHQGNDFQITDEFWDQVNSSAEQWYEPHAFVTFAGYEWSGNTPLGGDRNVYHLKPGGPIFRSSHALLPDEASAYPCAPDAEQLFDRLKEESSFVFAHVGGRYADLRMHKEGLEAAVEIHSAWGTFEWLAQDALKRGYTVGICANSDGHKCRPGSSYPGAGAFGSYGGLTCLLAPALTREDIFEALHRRRFYATTGHRPLMRVEAAGEGGTATLGDNASFRGTEVDFTVEYTAVSSLDYLEIIDAEGMVERILPPGGPVKGRRVKIIWSGAGRKGRAREVVWDGELRVKGGRIARAVPVNFWNPDRQPEVLDGTAVRWQSVTTGGICGLVLELEGGPEVRFSFQSGPLSCEFTTAALTREPTVWKAGGLGIQLAAYLLSDEHPAGRTVKASRSLALPAPGAGRRAVFIKAVEENGHMAWSSPIWISSHR
jgi:hypothetical protein